MMVPSTSPHGKAYREQARHFGCEVKYIESKGDADLCSEYRELLR